MNIGLLLLPFLLLPFSSLLPSVASSHYGVFPRREENNNYTLTCRIDDLTDPQHGIKWLFNGSDYRYHTSCFAGAVATANNVITFNHSSDCDGYIQCGNDTEYSLPVLLQADPEHSPFYQSGQINIVRPQGSSVTLPCNVIVSAVGGLNVRWVKNAGTPDRMQLTSLNEDYSITLTDLVPTSTSIFYRCDVITNTLFRGQVFSLQVVQYSPPNITSIEPRDGDEDEIEIILTSSGTSLDFSWLLDGMELKDDDDKVEIENGFRNGASTSTLKLSRSSITRAINITGIASNIDTTNSSDLRGMGSEVVKNRSDSVKLWLYPAVPTFPTQTTTPSSGSGSVCERKADVYMALFIASAIVAVFVLIPTIAAMGAILYCKSHCNRDENSGKPGESPDDSGNEYVQQCPGCIRGFTTEQKQSVTSFVLKLTSFIGDIGSQKYTSDEVKLLSLKITHYLTQVVEEHKKPARQVKPDGPSEETQVFDGARKNSFSSHHHHHQYEEIPYSTTAKPAELQLVTMLGERNTSLTATMMEEDDFIKNMFEGIDLKTVCKAMSSNECT